MTHWDIIKKWEDKLDKKDARAGMMLGDFIATLYQRGLLDKHILSSICDSGWANRDKQWGALHEFANTFKGMLEERKEDE